MIGSAFHHYKCLGRMKAQKMGSTPIIEMLKEEEI